MEPSNNAIRSGIFRGVQTNVQPEPNGHEFLARMIERSKKAKVETFSGIKDDPESIAIVACALRLDEKLGEFLSRTGLSIAQARTMTQSEILSFCLGADKRNGEEMSKPHALKTPPKFIAV